MLEWASVEGYDWGMPREMLDTSILDVPLVGGAPNGEAHIIYAEDILADLYRMVGVVNRLDGAGDFTEERLTTLTNMIKQPDSFIVHAAMIGLFRLYGVLDDYYELGEDRPRGWEVIMERPEHPGGFRVAYSERFSKGRRIGTQNVFYRAKSRLND